MPFTRYASDGYRYDFKGYQSTESISLIRSGIETGTIRIIKTLLLTQTDRVEHIAANLYGDARYWWVIAAASNIGWALQAPPGTVIIVPSLVDVEKLLSQG